ncbi:MAG: hypothetical protein V1660_01315, partial [archaeon]
MKRGSRLGVAFAVAIIAICYLAFVFALPEITPIIISPSQAYTNSTLNCSATYYNIDDYKGNVTLYWYNDSALYTNLTYLDIVSGSVVSIALLGIQAKNEIWNCTANSTDEMDIVSA